MQKQNKRLSIESSEQTGRLMPQARELEEAILGALFLEKQAFETASEIVSAESFYDKAHELIFTACAELNRESKPIDLLTVVNQLRKNGTLESVGGVSCIAQLSQKVISTAHLEYHCRIVNQKHLARKAIEVMSEMIGKCFDETNDIDDVISEISMKIEKIQEASIGKFESKQLNQVMKKSVSEMYERINKYQKGIQSGVNTGLADLNRVAGGWQKSNLVIIAGRPSMGKTAVALHFAKSAARTGIPVVVFELEMSDVKLSDRILLSESNVDPNDYKVGKISLNDAKTVESAVGKLYNYRIEIDSNPVVNMDYIRNRCRMLKKQGKCEMVILDYLQLVEDSGNKDSIREQEVARMSRKAKLLAKELDIPILLLAQLNRKCEDRTSTKKPMLSDLRESGAIEQDADMVIFIYRDEYYNKNAPKGQGNLIIAKYRDGYTGEIDFCYNESMTKIFDCDRMGQSQQAIEIKNYHEPQEKTPF